MSRPPSFYDIKEMKRTRLNRRDTRVIAVTPQGRIPLRLPAVDR